MGWKYKTKEEAQAAAKAKQKAYYAARKAGTWVRKNKVHSPRIAAKLGVLTAEQQRRLEKGSLNLERILAKHGSIKAYEEYLESRRAWRESLKAMSPEDRAAALHAAMLKDEAEYRARNREHITKYNREYRRRKREAAMTPEQRARKAELDRRTVEGVVGDLVKILAAEQGVTVDDMTARFLEAGAVDFIVNALEGKSFRQKCAYDRTIRIALPAVRFFLDRENATMV